MVKLSKSKTGKQYVIRYKRHKFKVLLDKIILFRLLRRLHGRFWGVAGALGLFFGISICFLIKPEMFKVATAISDFGSDVRTAPYFAGSMFFASYGLWRWRNYLRRTLKRTKPVLGLLGLTIFGLLVVAFMPVGVSDLLYKFHLIGMSIMGASAGATVIFDILLTKTPRKYNANPIRLIKMCAFLLIIVGGWLTLGSSNWLNWFHVSLPGEIMIIGGYFMWIVLKTYQGEDQRSRLSRLLKKVILVD